MDYKQATIDSYNQNAKEFSNRYKKRMNVGKRSEFQKFISLVNTGKILDIWCWPGYHSLYFKQQWFEVTAIDLSETMISLCKENGIEAQLMDIENLTFADQSFDGIRAATSLLHIPKANLHNVIKKIYDILKDNGILHVSVKEGTGEGLVQDKEWDKKRFFAFRDEEEFKKVVEHYFICIDTEKIEEKDATFLKMFFRKK